MKSRMLGIGSVVLIGILVLGAVAVLALPGDAEAAFGGPRRAGVGQDSVTWTRGAQGVQANTGTNVDLVAAPGPITDGVYMGELDESEAEALIMALDDEYKAWSVYDQVVADFGRARPFTNIQKAEENHIAALVTLFDRYGLDVPVNTWADNVSHFDTLAEACEAGVQAEIDNAVLYDELFGMVDNPDIIRVFQALQQASQTKHLPAFERCAP
ncbi:MAG: DUF2202 domain-containing protein [Anaerolineae bacterium]